MMLWGNIRLCIWRVQTFTLRKDRKPTAELRHIPGQSAWGPFWHQPTTMACCHLKPLSDLHNCFQHHFLSRQLQGTWLQMAMCWPRHISIHWTPGNWYRVREATRTQQSLPVLCNPGVLEPELVFPSTSPFLSVTCPAAL